MAFPKFSHLALKTAVCTNSFFFYQKPDFHKLLREEEKIAVFRKKLIFFSFNLYSRASSSREKEQQLKLHVLLFFQRSH